ncbi:MAG: tetratricopeptide repeat protein [Planctomycetia bacterium]|nr:tetratricopeptide repeat protein [Planctomycetia bacterium]
MAHSPWIVEVSMDNFQEAVVNASRDRPVVIDFWAPWCEPCRALAPLLEKLAIEKDGGFLLAKVNTDENPELAQAFQVEGIPAVFAVRNGQLANHFTGLLPEEQLREFIESLGPATPREPTPLELAQKLEATDPNAAVEAYRAMLATAPDDPAVRVGLARSLLATPGHEAEVSPLLTGVDFGDFADEAKRLNMMLQLREVPHTASDFASAQQASTAEGKLELGKVLAAQGDYTGAMDALLAAAEDDRALGRSGVRELMLKIFDVIGPQSQQASDYRRRLQNLLY